MMLSCRGGLQESPMLVSDLASARKFMGWQGTAGEARGLLSSRRGWGGGLPAWGTQPLRFPFSPKRAP